MGSSEPKPLTRKVETRPSKSIRLLDLDPDHFLLKHLRPLVPIYLYPFLRSGFIRPDIILVFRPTFLFVRIVRPRSLGPWCRRDRSPRTSVSVSFILVVCLSPGGSLPIVIWSHLRTPVLSWCNTRSFSCLWTIFNRDGGLFI